MASSESWDYNMMEKGKSRGEGKRWCLWRPPPPLILFSSEFYHSSRGCLIACCTTGNNKSHLLYSNIPKTRVGGEERRKRRRDGGWWSIQRVGNNGSQLGVRQKPRAELSYAMHVFSVFCLNVYLFQRSALNDWQISVCVHNLSAFREKTTFQNEAHAGGERHVAYEDSDPLTGKVDRQAWGTDGPRGGGVHVSTCVWVRPRESACLCVILCL